jgi:hypothetical protein
MTQVPADTLTVHGEGSEWWIESAGRPDGPYVDEQAAIDAAIDRAKGLVEVGHAATTVVVRRGEGSSRVWPPE